jgi:ankyrin repeat protein
MKDLLARGADVNEKDGVGNTALMYAAGRLNYMEVARLLVDKGALINEPATSGNTALILACAVNNTEMVRFLLAKGVELDNRNKAGWTAEEIAKSKGYHGLALMIKEAADTRRNLAEEKARREAAHNLAIERQQRLKKMRPPSPLRP